jgi:hypothetical protein
MLLTLKLALRRLVWLVKSRFTKYAPADSPKGLRRTMLRRHNQRRERGNVALYLGKRRGRYNATA